MWAIDIIVTDDAWVYVIASVGQRGKFSYHMLRRRYTD